MRFKPSEITSLALLLSLSTGCGGSAVRLQPATFAELQQGRLAGVELEGEFEFDRLQKACLGDSSALATQVRWEDTYGRYCELNGIVEGDFSRVILQTSGLSGGVQAWYAEPRWGPDESTDAARLARLGLEQGAPLYVLTKLGVLYESSDPTRYLVRELVDEHTVGPIKGITSATDDVRSNFHGYAIVVAESRAAADRAYEEGDPTGAWSALRLLKTVRHPDADSLEARFITRFREEPLARIAELKAALPSADASTRWALLDTILTEARLAWHSSADSTHLDLGPTLDSFVRGSPADSPIRSLLTVEKVGAEVLAGLTDRQFERIRDQLAALAEDALRAVEAPRGRPSTGLAGELAAHDERMTAYQRSFAEGGEERWKEVNESRVALDQRLVTETDTMTELVKRDK